VPAAGEVDARTLQDFALLPPAARVVFTSAEHGGSWSVEALATRGRSLGAALAARGVRPGDRVAVQVPNWPEAVVAYLAGFIAGAVVVPIVHIYGPAEVGFILRQSGARVLIVPDHWRAIDYTPVIATAAGVPTLDEVIVIGDEVPAGCTAWTDAEQAARGATSPLGRGHPDDVCLLVYTSGTTAEPKGVQHTHRTLMAEVRSTQDLLGGGVTLQSFPAGHIAGLLGVLRPIMGCCSTVCMDAWDPVLAARLVAEHRATFTAGTPLHLATLLDAAAEAGDDLSSLRSYMTGAASVPPSLVERAERAGVPTYRCYGSSEHPTVTSGRADDPLEKRATTDGRLLAGNEVCLVDDEGREAPSGGTGEVCTRGPELFVGYREVQLNTDAFLPDGWFRTGDVGSVDAHGYLTITDRKKDVIIRGGENISSKEVEDVLARYPGVGEVAVVGVGDERYGEVVCAVVVPTMGTRPSLEDLRRHVLESGLARQKAPDRLELVTELPRTAAGKVKKFELRGRIDRNPRGR
jgi:acyl-CoA synthetase (AMP-forming)/AMP-acid ligase II